MRFISILALVFGCLLISDVDAGPFGRNGNHPIRKAIGEVFHRRHVEVHETAAPPVVDVTPASPKTQPKKMPTKKVAACGCGCAVTGVCTCAECPNG